MNTSQLPRYALRVLDSAQCLDRDLPYASLEAAIEAFMLADYRLLPRVTRNGKTVLELNADGDLAPVFWGPEIAQSYISVFNRTLQRARDTGRLTPVLTNSQFASA